MKAWIIGAAVALALAAGYVAVSYAIGKDARPREWHER